MKIGTLQAEPSALGHVVECDVNGLTEAVFTSTPADSRVADIVPTNEAERGDQSVFHLKPDSRIQRESGTVGVVRQIMLSQSFLSRLL
jgi:hypothetical protein